MTKEQMAVYSAIGATPGELWIIEKGNEMLAQANMPPMTADQAKAFLVKRRARNALRVDPIAVALIGGGLVLAMLEKNPQKRATTLWTIGAGAAGTVGYMLGKRA